MKKFLKTAIAGVALVGCATSLVGCGGEKDSSISPDKAFSTVYQTMGTTLGKFANGYNDANIDTVKNMLTIDLDLGYSMTTGGETESEGFGLKAILQSSFGDSKKMCALLGLKNEDELKVLMSAYIKDVARTDENYTPITEATDFDNTSMFVYKKVTNGDVASYVPVTENDTWAENTYYMLTSDTLVAYLSSQLQNLGSFVMLTSAPDDWFDNNSYTEGRYYYLDDNGVFQMLTAGDVYPEFGSFTKVYSRSGEGTSVYTELTTEPADWKTNWKNYYVDDENAGDVESGKSPLFMMHGTGFYTTFKQNKYYERTGIDIRNIGEGLADSLGFEIAPELLEALYSGKIAISCDYVQLIQGLLGSGSDGATGDSADLPSTDDSAEAPATDDETVLASIIGLLSGEGLDFETFKALLTDETTGICPFTFSGKQENGKTTFSMKYSTTETEEGWTEYDGVTINFIADKNGSFEIAVKYEMSQEYGGELVGEMSVDFSLKVAYKQDFDEQYVPTDEQLKEYGEPVDFMEILEGLIGGGEGPEAIE